MRALLSTGMGEGELGAVVGCLSTIIVMGALLALCGKKSTIPSPQPDPSANSAEMPIHASAEYPDQKEGHDQVIVNAPHQPTPEWAVPSAGPSQEHHPGSQPAPAPPQQTAPAPRQPPQPNPPARVRPWLCLVEKRIASADQLAPELYESSVVQISPSSQGYPPVDAYENTDLSGTQGGVLASVRIVLEFQRGNMNSYMCAVLQSVRRLAHRLRAQWRIPSALSIQCAM